MTRFVIDPDPQRFRSAVDAALNVDPIVNTVPTLFTDLANPTSNGIYLALGYRPVADSLMLDFVPPG